MDGWPFGCATHVEIIPGLCEASGGAKEGVSVGEKESNSEIREVGELGFQ